MLHRSAARPARYPKTMKPAELSPNASAYCRRGESVDVLQHEGRAGEVGEQRGVQRTPDEHGTEEDPVGEQRAEVAQVCANPPDVRRSTGSVSRKTEQGRRARMPAPIAARKTNSPRQSVTVVEHPAEQRADDRGEPADDGESPVEPDQRAAGVEVAARGLGDDDSDTAREALHEPRRRSAARSLGLIAHSADVSDVRDDPDQQDAAPPEPVRQRTGDQLPRGQPDQAGGDRSAAPRRSPHPARAVRAGSAGRYRSIEIGPNTVSSSSSVGSSRRTRAEAGAV